MRHDCRLRTRCRELTLDAPDHRACRCAGSPAVRQIAVHGDTAGPPLQPSTESGQISLVRRGCISRQGWQRGPGVFHACQQMATARVPSSCCLPRQRCETSSFQLGWPLNKVESLGSFSTGRYGAPPWSEGRLRLTAGQSDAALDEVPGSCRSRGPAIGNHGELSIMGLESATGFCA